MTGESKKRMEELRSAYRYGVWPDVDKDKASTRDADLACLGFEAGFDACDEEIVQKLQAENKKLREALSKDNLLEIIEEWQMIWRNQKINPEDTKRYRRRALSVDANMRYSLARMISEKALSSGGE